MHHRGVTGLTVLRLTVLGLRRVPVESAGGADAGVIVGIGGRRELLAGMALELSGGTAVVSDMDDPQAEELLFSANFACPICGYSMRELEPRLFQRFSTGRARSAPSARTASASRVAESTPPE